MFEINISQFIDLANKYKYAKTTLARASGATLNDIAFLAKRRMAGVISETMTVRNPRFVGSRIQVSKSRLFAPVAGQHASVGSVAKERFTGWAEQETGQSPARERALLLLARRGDIKRQALPSARLKSSNKILHPHDVRMPGPISYRRQAYALMRMLRKSRRKTPFMLTRLSGWKPGLYQMVGGRARLVQSFEPMHPKRVRWLEMTLSRIQDTNIIPLWNKNLLVALERTKLKI